jgi:hypothetical protein
MPEPSDRTIAAESSARPEIDLRGLIRLASWGAAAAAALMLAVFAARSDTGSRRMAATLGPASTKSTAPQPDSLAAAAARTAELEFETRQMAIALRSLSADRDRLLARVTVLERNLDDVTGSISRQTRSARQPEPTPETGTTVQTTQSLPLPVAIGPSLVATISSPLTIPSPSPQALASIGLPSIPTIDDENIATRTDFGVDVGSGPNLRSLRTTWAAIKQSHAELFEGLYPVVTVRDGGKPGSIELRLVVGPLNNAAAAARLCGRVANAGMSCQPAIFDGQRLALR